MCNKDEEISSSEKIVTICYALCNHCELIYLLHTQHNS